MKSINKNSIKSTVIIFVAVILFTGLIISSAAKNIRADSFALDSIEKQIRDLDNLNYKAKDIKKIVLMTNNDVDFFCNVDDDIIAIGITESNDIPKDVRQIRLKGYLTE